MFGLNVGSPVDSKTLEWISEASGLLSLIKQYIHVNYSFSNVWTSSYVHRNLYALPTIQWSNWIDYWNKISYFRCWHQINLGHVRVHVQQSEGCHEVVFVDSVPCLFRFEYMQCVGVLTGGAHTANDVLLFSNVSVSKNNTVKTKLPF